jgi:F-type H+-transporting ATPase subunit gamma
MPSLQHKINSANDLRAVVRTMKAMAASNISQYEQAMLSLEDYYRNVRLGVTAYTLNQHQTIYPRVNKNKAIAKQAKFKHRIPAGLVVIGSDQGLVGQFNESLFSFVQQSLENYQLNEAIFWPVGERMQSKLAENKFDWVRSFTLPRSIDFVTSLVTDLLLEIEEQRSHGNVEDIYLFFNHPTSPSNYAPTIQKFLPIDNRWLVELAFEHWPDKAIPQLIDGSQQSLTSLLHEYLFVSLFKACTASLASENTSRLIAMQRAEKNIEDLQDRLNRNYHQRRQQAVDEELFDLVGGFEALQT